LFSIEINDETFDANIEDCNGNELKMLMSQKNVLTTVQLIAHRKNVFWLVRISIEKWNYSNYNQLEKMNTFFLSWRTCLPCLPAGRRQTWRLYVTNKQVTIFITVIYICPRKKMAT